MALVSDMLDAIDFIEENLENRISLEDIAKRSHLSKYHFHRVFRALTGRTVSDYLWKRRLTCSLEKLIHTDCGITDIALGASFSDAASYTHAFKQYFGVAPSCYRKTPNILPVCERLQAHHFSENGKGLMMRPEIVFLPAFAAVGARHKIFYGENRIGNTAYRAGMEFYAAYRDSIMGAKDRDIYIGVTQFPKGEPYTWYFPALEVAPDAEVPDGLEKLTIPSSQCACFRYAGMHDLSKLSQNMFPLFEEVFLKWMPSMTDSYVPWNIERIPRQLCSQSFCQIELYYALYSRTD